MDSIPDSIPKLGDVIDVYCEQCRLNLDASIAAIEGSEVKQVQCRTCGNFVRFRPPVPDSVRKERAVRRVLAMRERKSPRPAAESAVAKPLAPQPSASARWAQLTDGVNSTRAVPYVASRRYREGDYILHKGYGMGYVERVLDEDQVLVLFRTGEQTLSINQPAD